MTDPQATAQPTKTYEDGLREAVEIAREAVRGLDPDESSFDEGAEWARDTIAAAIEAKAGDK